MQRHLNSIVRRLLLRSGYFWNVHVFAPGSRRGLLAALLNARRDVPSSLSRHHDGGNESGQKQGKPHSEVRALFWLDLVEQLGCTGFDQQVKRSERRGARLTATRQSQGRVEKGDGTAKTPRFYSYLYRPREGNQIDGKSRAVEGQHGAVLGSSGIPGYTPCSQ